MREIVLTEGLGDIDVPERESPDQYWVAERNEEDGRESGSPLAFWLVFNVAPTWRLRRVPQQFADSRARAEFWAERYIDDRWGDQDILRALVGRDGRSAFGRKFSNRSSVWDGIEEAWQEHLRNEAEYARYGRALSAGVSYTFCRNNPGGCISPVSPVDPECLSCGKRLDTSTASWKIRPCEKCGVFISAAVPDCKCGKHPLFDCEHCGKRVLDSSGPCPECGYVDLSEVEGLRLPETLPGMNPAP